jgi:hypothetical protein
MNVPTAELTCKILSFPPKRLGKSVFHFDLVDSFSDGIMDERMKESETSQIVAEIQ